mmetsp:Transcript_14975/g.40166  ORF Transcript_14975/g.40166 Transcript_14975/m.40166 type:complete len:243 (+) Transcript_14975:145-873(+)|eukprot:CAMPEP_0185829388 /NCGR_PEP_ID=MMETSP1353-20130828/215_1 /TAXON_ID=1077150 /ORGANISM="Erythrolobus australicus, Strain CCMP3124" /LENGTH=242 /DNA_ID=CAMNT_0028527175 /DNA_START=134 /DNA_END=862 /DNA_ORIENTATION=+
MVENADITAPLRLSRARSRSVGRKEVSLNLAADENESAGYGTDSKEEAQDHSRGEKHVWTPSVGAAAGIVVLVVLALVGSVRVTTMPDDALGFSFARRETTLHPGPMCTSAMAVNMTQCVKLKHHGHDESMLMLLLENAQFGIEKRALFTELFQEREELVESEYMCISDSSAEMLGKLAAALSEDSVVDDLKERKDSGASLFDPMTANFGQLKKYCPEICTSLGVMNANEDLMMRTCCSAFY